MELDRFHNDVLSLIINECDILIMFAFLFVSKRYRKIALTNKKLCDNLYELAASHGFLGILSWAHNNGCAFYENTLCLAISEGHLDIVKWAIKKNLFDKCYGPHLEYYIRSPVDDAINVAIERGHLHVLKWLYRNKYINVYDLDYFKDEYDYPATHLAALHNHLNILKWLCRIGCYCDFLILYIAASEGYLDIIIFLYNKHPQWFVEVEDGTDLNKCKDIIEWSYNKGPLMYLGDHHLDKKCKKKHCLKKNIIEAAIKHGHLHIIKWLKEKKLFRIVPNVPDDYYFMAKKYRQYMILEWFDKMNGFPSKINGFAICFKIWYDI
jgi:hypothetical protein